MRKNKKLASHIPVALAIAALMGTSAFAETRPSNETRRRGEARATVRQERSVERHQSDGSRNTGRQGVTMRGQSRGPEAGTAERRGTTRGTEGTYERRGTTRGTEGTYERRGTTRGTEGTYERRGTTRGTEGTYERRGTTRGTEGTYERRGTTQGSSRGTYDRRDSSRSDRGRYDNRGSRGSYGNRQQFHHRGPVTRYQRYGSGYRVWVGGAPYPFFVPLSYWHPSRFRVGLVINLGGYYNPGGYYDYYDGYRGYDYRSTSRGLLRGTVESVDYGRDTFVVRNEATGSFVTVIARDRRGRDVRPGDFVEMSGTWDRSGLFQAYDVDLLDDGYRDYRY